MPSKNNVTIIPASISMIAGAPLSQSTKRRVAAYARVSTDSSEQENSFEAQCEYYTKYINKHPDWEFVTVYSDEGITGCNTKKREGFKSMVADALLGMFDLIITKSVSRFARNTVDSLQTIRTLKEHVALEKLHGQHSVRALCEALDVSRGTFYNHIFRRKDVAYRDKRREEMRAHIKAVFEDSRQRYGANKVCAVLTDRGIRVTPKYVAELMREMDLNSVNKDSKREHKKKLSLNKKQNVLQRKFNTIAPNIVWVSDVTCFKVKEQYFYICVIMDLFSRRVVSHAISKNNSTYLITSTFRKAFKNRECPQNLTFHSDRGVQYTSNAFRKLLCMNKVVQSFSNSGKPHDNAVAEAFFASLKKEELYRTNYKSESQFRESVEDYVLFYNTERPHRTLAYRTPDRFEQEYDRKKNPA